MKILIVLTSHDRLGETGEKTGFWLEEFAAPYYAFLDAGAVVTLASPAGGQPPLDPKSSFPENQTESTRRFQADVMGQAALAATLPLVQAVAGDYDALFFPGGHGPMWDLANEPCCAKLVNDFLQAGKPVGAVCHAPAALVNVRTPDGDYLVKGKKVTGFSNAEETAIGLDKVVPFLLEDRLRAHGGLYSRAPEWQAHAVVDGLLVTGQNPASSVPVAEALLYLLQPEQV